MSNYRQKAPFNDWWYWSDVLAKRYQTVSEIYRENDEAQRANETAGVAKMLHDNFIGPARIGQKGTKTPEERAALAKIEEEAIFKGIQMWKDCLTALPFISTHMQEFLGCKWEEIGWDKGGEPRAVMLFWGPKGRTDEGIRSGYPKDGGLPGILMNYILAERSSSSRSPSEWKVEKAHNTYWGRAPGIDVGRK